MAENSDNIPSAKDEQEELTILPRGAWNSQIAYLKAIMKAKQALDRTEKAFMQK